MIEARELIASICEARLVNLPRKVIAYHVGSELRGGRFSLKYVGSGEGRVPGAFRPLGDGIYFATEEFIARLYTKYVPEPVLYTVQLDTRRLYNPTLGTPLNIRAELFKRRDAITGGRDLRVSELHRVLDKITLGMIKDRTISGQWDNLPAGGQELAVTDLSVVKIIKSERISK